MSEFTPGPWTAFDDGRSIEIDNVELGRAVCILTPTCNAGNDLPLILAAPDMYAALEQVLEIRSLWEVPDEINKISQQIEVALRKARGQVTANG